MAENLNYEAEGSKCYDKERANCKKYGRFHDMAMKACPSGWFFPNAERNVYILTEVTGNCKKYGRLYNRESAKMACPSGWHLPDTTEWKILMATVGGEETAGKYLKATNGWNWNNYDDISGNGEDKYGFSALPGGYGGKNDHFNDVGYDGFWWSDSENSSIDANRWTMSFHFNNAFYYGYGGKSGLFSIRCLQDTPTPPKGETK